MAFFRELLHLALQLLGFAAQHLLFPLLLEGLLRILLPVGKILLPLGQRIELRQSVLDVFFVPLGRSHALGCLVLVLGSIQFQIEQAGQVAACVVSASSSSSSLLSESNLDMAEGGFSTQE